MFSQRTSLRCTWVCAQARGHTLSYTDVTIAAVALTHKQVLVTGYGMLDQRVIA